MRGTRVGGPKGRKSSFDETWFGVPENNRKLVTGDLEVLGDTLPAGVVVPMNGHNQPIVFYDFDWMCPGCGRHNGNKQTVCNCGRSHPSLESCVGRQPNNLSPDKVVWKGSEPGISWRSEVVTGWLW